MITWWSVALQGIGIGVVILLALIVLEKIVGGAIKLYNLLRWLDYNQTDIDEILSDQPYRKKEIKNIQTEHSKLSGYIDRFVIKVYDKEIEELKARISELEKED